MNVIVFGATGTVGKLAVSELLASGHAVTAFARHPERLGLDHPQLSHHAGDALDAADVSAAVKGQDAVLVVLGAGMSRRSRIRSDGTLNVIRAMQAHGPRRLIVQSTLGARDSWNTLNFWWKRVMFGALLAPVFRDHELQERLVEASGLDWTIVRPGAFTDAATKRPVIEDVPNTARGLDLKIRRADLARFLCRQVADRTYLHRAVGLSS
ncbi:SDR family oxidoreductase [Roseibacterium sp. SDUM158016]|uniref:NAD(P)-dependent oxidoreductase n=1 Tax=Roseicyclus sediminis TaxID=2980997 RepID=UPI0021D3D4DF|nr:NAD(P)-binding oxidoreductase [Roseibacterium sp. SDUM158016]MCU4653963.1 SDR family oxidoreductase [Roseibacterium sp. SDUM158016]